MDKPACSRLWQAEAILDGRLHGTELASFERHTATCRVCAGELEHLRELHQMAAELPVLETTPLERRRQRQNLLRRANQLAVEPPRVSHRALGVAIVLVATTAMASGGAYVVRSLGRAAQANSVQQLARSTTRMGARSGAHASPPAQTLSKAPVRRAKPSAAAPSAAVLARAPEPRPMQHHPQARRPVRVADNAPVPRARERRHQAALRATRTQAPGAPDKRAPTAGQDFAVAMGAFNAGDFGRAEHLFTAFVNHHPGDSRAEDASFLRAVASQRRGDTAGAKALAREYLENYPGALRQEEAEAMLAR